MYTTGQKRPLGAESAVLSTELHPEAHDERPRVSYLVPMEDPLTGGPYEIVVGAALDKDWSRWFEGFEVSGVGRHTRLVGTVEDQAALHGLFARLRDLAIPILEVHRLTGPQEERQRFS